MSAFEDFVQLELPKRPFLETNPSEETVMVRRGLGPRQLTAVALNEGEVLAKVGGVIVGTTISALVAAGGGAVRKAILPVVIAADTWTIEHNLNSENVIVQIFDNQKYVVIPNSIQIVDADTVVVQFNTAITGVARVIFLD